MSILHCQVKYPKTLKLGDVRALIVLLTNIPCIWTMIPGSLDNNVALLWFQLEIELFDYRSSNIS